MVVIETMTPPGVEHTMQRLVEKYADTVIETMTPPGVEHSKPKLDRARAAK